MLGTQRWLNVAPAFLSVADRRVNENSPASGSGVCFSRDTWGLLRSGGGPWPSLRSGVLRGGSLEGLCLCSEPRAHGVRQMKYRRKATPSRRKGTYRDPQASGGRAGRSGGVRGLV